MSIILKIFTIYIIIKKHEAVNKGYHRLGDFPSPDFSTTIKLSTQGYGSFAEVTHEFGKLPFYVRVYATSSDGDNAGYLFEGTGACQNDGRDSGPFGGIIFAYNDKTIRIWGPTHGVTNKVSAVVFVGQGWGGNLNSQSSLVADVVIHAWKNGPDPTFETDYELDTSVKSKYQLIHGLRQIPEMVSIRITPTNEIEGSSFMFHATGASQTVLTSKTYGGVIFAYNEHKIMLWTPKQSKSTGCIIISKRWGNGKHSSEVSSRSCKVNIRLWIDSYPPPIYQSEWQFYSANQHQRSFIEQKHALKFLPSYVKVQYRFPNKSQSLVFEATGSVQSTELTDNRYGGVTYAFDESKVRIWLPSSVKKDQSYAIFVGDGWGNTNESMISEAAEIKISIYAQKCLTKKEVVDAQGFCRDTTEVSLVQVMSEWSKCSNPCSIGAKSRSMKECSGRSMKALLSCRFETNMCEFKGSPSIWIRSTGASTEFEKILQIPTYGIPKGSYFIYTNTQNAKPGDREILLSPIFEAADNCILSFKYSTGAYFGKISVDVLGSNDKWVEDIWFMKDDETRGPNTWLNGYLNIGAQVPKLKQFQFTQELNPYIDSCPDQCHPVSISNVLLECEQSDHQSMPAKKCEEKEEKLDSCLFDVFKPHSRGKAWNVSEPVNMRNEKIGTYVTASGTNDDVIASYSFKVKKAGAYFLWVDSFALTNATNGVTVQIGTAAKISRNLIWNKSSALWLPISHEFVLDAGEHHLTLYQLEQGFCYRNIMIAPKTLTSWYDLGMQNHLIPDSNFDSLTGSHLNLVHSRLNGIAAWMPTDNTGGHFYLQITLPDLALINKIATQGGTWLDSGQPNWYCTTKLYKMKISLDGKSFVHYRNSSLNKVHQFRGNNGQNKEEINDIVEHYLEYAVPARAVRFYPLTFDLSGCLRVELYGYYMNKGMCPEIKSKIKAKECVGDGKCPQMNAQCQQDEVTNTTSCDCNDGFHGSDCQQEGCITNLCSNNATCKEEGGNFQCVCQPGFYGKFCESRCPIGRYGAHCLSKCQCPNMEYCNPMNGQCSCFAGYYGNKCDQPCTNRTFGQDCREKCQCAPYMDCDHVTGNCYCPKGFHGNNCDVSCQNKTFGRNCSMVCSCKNQGICNPTNGQCNCPDGWFGDHCQIPCPSGRYGKGCSKLCEHPENSTCDPIFGNHTCNPGLKGQFCNQPCDSKHYGSGCVYECNCVDNNTKYCNSSNGHCVCKDGHQGDRCESVCDESNWGFQCNKQCKCENGGSCHHVTGSCTCLGGYVGKYCENLCPDGFHGEECKHKCNCTKSFTAKCDPESGVCNCVPGYQGQICDQKCGSKKWGKNCNNPCRCLNDAECDHRDGYCYCKSGYKGQFCESTCSNGTYGKSCKEDCQCKNNADCASVDGYCECLAGFKGRFCEEECNTNFYGLHCLNKCQCVEHHTSHCNSVNGSCSCLPGYQGSLCEKTCDDGSYGAQCQQKCFPCSHAEGACDKVLGNCSCTEGFNGYYCKQDCQWSHYGLKCSNLCMCDITDLCNNIDGSCYSKAEHVFPLNILAMPNVFHSESIEEFKKRFELLVESCFDQWTDFPKGTNISNYGMCKHGRKRRSNGTDDFLVRVVDKKEMYTTQNDVITTFTLSLLRNNQPIKSSVAIDLLTFIGYENMSMALSYTVYKDGVFSEKTADSWFTGETKWIVIGVASTCGLTFLILVYVAYRCTRRISQPASFRKIRRANSDDPVELTPCLMKSNSHLLAFDNPYYDVIAAMGLDDDIEEDYLNPLFEFMLIPPDSDTELDDIHYAYRNDVYHQPRHQYPGYEAHRHYPYDKDSGFSSGTIER